MSVVNNWEKRSRAFRSFTQGTGPPWSGRDVGDDLVRKSQKQDIVVTTYSLAHRDEATLSKIRWECLVLDEAQNIKNPSARQSQAVRKLNSRYRIALTGTPGGEPTFRTLVNYGVSQSGYLKIRPGFPHPFCHSIEKFHSPAQTEKLKRLIQPFVLRRVKTDSTIINDLPEKIETKVFCNLTKEQATLYEAIVKEMLEKIAKSEGIERKGLVLSTLLKLKQVCNHPAQFLQDQSVLPGRSGKFLRLEEDARGNSVRRRQGAHLYSVLPRWWKNAQTASSGNLHLRGSFLHGGTPVKHAMR